MSDGIDASARGRAAAHRPSRDSPPRSVATHVAGLGRQSGPIALRTATDALDAGGVVYCLRNPTADLMPEPGGDVDVLISPSQRRAAARALAGCGWHLLGSPGHWGHQFWLYLTDDAQVVKIDVVWRLRYGTIVEATPAWLARRRLRNGVHVAAPTDVDRHREHRAAGLRERPGLLERAARRVPPAMRRSGPVLALLGPDGAGKGLVVDSLTEQLPIAVTVGYLGVGQARPRGRRSGGAVPQPGDTPGTDHRRGADRRPPGAAGPEPRVRARELAFLTRKWLRTLPTFYRAYRAAWRGHVVLLDRHPLDALAVLPRRTRWGSRWERMLAQRLTPRPDAIVVLDAPGTVLFARKGEHDPELLERWRQGYLRLQGPDVHVVDATRPAADVVAEATRLVWRELARRRRWSGEGQSARHD